MKRLSILLWLILSYMLCAQTPKPDWCDVESRRIAYPENSFFTGFAIDHRQSGESIGDALARVENSARADAATHIEVKVVSNTLAQVESLQQEGRNGLDESISSYFSQQNISSTSIQIANLQVITWHSSDNNEVAALAYVKKRDFARYHDRQIESLIGKMESAMENISNQELQGQKIKAVKTAEDALLLCKDVEYSQRMVVLADPEATPDDLQMPRYTAAVKMLANSITRLKHATAYFIDCKATIDGKNYLAFDKEIRGMLAEKGCHFTNTRENADWIIEIDASVTNTSHREGMPHFSYVDGSIMMTNVATNQKILEDRLSSLKEGNNDGIKGGDFSAEKAAHIAYHNAAIIIAESIIKNVTK